jgi:NitT/TauT family transport system ATP-binding protein
VLSGRRSRAVDQPTVRVTNLRKQFAVKDDSPVVAVDQLTMEVGREEFVSIIGPSGCGKSTLLALIAGLDKPSAGAIEIGGELVESPYTDAGVVFQRDLLLEWRTCLGNILLQFELRGQKASDHVDRAVELLELVGVEKFAQRLPRQLSGGMRQRVAICRALVHDPTLLLMDEPFGALDALTRERLNVDLERICASTAKSVVFITHSIQEAVFLSDRVLVMSPRPGTIVESIPITASRPRSLDLMETPEFGATVRRIRAVLNQEGAYADAEA